MHGVTLPTNSCTYVLWHMFQHRNLGKGLRGRSEVYAHDILKVKAVQVINVVQWLHEPIIFVSWVTYQAG